MKALIFTFSLILTINVYSQDSTQIRFDHNKVSKPSCFFEDVEGIYTKTEVPVTYKCGQSALDSFIRLHYNYSLIKQNGAKRKKYPVAIWFIVDTDGSTCDFQSESKNKYGIDKEMIRVLQLTIAWEPAKQNGKAVASYTHQYFEIQL